MREVYLTSAEYATLDPYSFEEYSHEYEDGHFVCTIFSTSDLSKVSDMVKKRFRLTESSNWGIDVEFGYDYDEDARYERATICVF